MLNDTLDNSEVKDASGVEVIFSRHETKDRSVVYAKVGESPALQDRLTISHGEIGSGLKRRRRSLVRFDLTAISDVDNITPATDSGYVVLDSPVGARMTNANAAAVLARLMSFLASTGADTTIKYNGTGNGAVALLNGSL